MKKKKITAAVIAAAAVIAMAGCSDGQTEDAAKSAPVSSAAASSDSAKSAEAEFSELQAIFKKPAEFVSLDTSQDDPSTAEIKLLYDDKKRIVGAYYTIEGHPIMANYAYDDNKNTVEILTFAESYIIDQTELQLPAYDAEAGFTENNGYYFRGYRFD